MRLRRPAPLAIRPRISVVVPCHDYAAYLPAAVGLLLALVAKDLAAKNLVGRDGRQDLTCICKTPIMSTITILNGRISPTKTMRQVHPTLSPLLGAPSILAVIGHAMARETSPVTTYNCQVIAPTPYIPPK